jgi:hypothetical protein
MSDQISEVVSSKVKLSHSFFENQAFVIPTYQRSYSWGKDQVRNLIADMYGGLVSLGNVQTPSEEYTFFGTIITVIKSSDFENYGPQTPSQFHEIVDGQQRIITLSLVAMNLEDEINKQCQIVVNDPQYVTFTEELTSISDMYCRKLQNTYSTKTHHPRHRIPLIIREESDRWQEGEYKSSLSRFVRDVIRSEKLPDIAPHQNDLLLMNSQQIQDILQGIKINNTTVLVNDSDVDSVAEFDLNILSIVTRISDLELWDRRNVRFKSHIITEPSQTDTPLIALVRLLLLAYYMTNKCVVNHIVAKKQNWAFDMFVSLNTTGIPLTAIETFRANLLVQIKSLMSNNVDMQKDVQHHVVDLYTNQDYGVYAYFDKETEITKKAKKTKEFITTFALLYNGTKLGYDLQRQRTWLQDTLSECAYQKTSRERSDAIKLYVSRIQHLLKFLVMRDRMVSKGIIPDNLQSVANIDMAKLCLKFLVDVNHTIVDALLSRFYEREAKHKHAGKDDFVQSVCAVTAFFSLWRSVRGTSGLPDVYRSGMSKYFSYFPNDNTLELNIADLKKYLRDKLLSHVDGKNLLEKSTWVSLAERELRLRGMKDLSRFVIFIALDNTVKDGTNPGLIVPAAQGYAEWANFSSWTSSHYETIEHIAPQKPDPNGNWDAALYDDRDLFDRVGNLALLPVSINSSVGNNSWVTKWIYYSHLAEADPKKSTELGDFAKSLGITLKPNTIKLLQKAQFNYHMDPIVAVGQDGTWDAELVEKRTRRMLEIFHDRMMQWLQD